MDKFGQTYLVPVSPKTKPAPGAKAPAGGGGAAPGAGAAVAARPVHGKEPYEYEKVVKMQRLLGDISTGISKDLESVVKRILAKNDKLDSAALTEELKKDANTIGVTASKSLIQAGGGQYDGKWGPSTNGALKIVNKLAKYVESNEVLDTSVNSYRVVPAATVAKRAEENSKKLISIFKDLGLTLPGYVGVEGADFDSIPMRIRDVNIDPLGDQVASNRYKVTQGELSDLFNFYVLIDRLGIDRAIPSFASKAASREAYDLEKIASVIRNSFIIKEAQVTDPEGVTVSGLGQTGGIGPDTPEQQAARERYTNKSQTKGNISVGDFDRAVWWFSQRAKRWMTAIKMLQARRQEHPVLGRVPNARDESVARAYDQAMQNIARQWARVRAEAYANVDDPDKTPVDPHTLGGGDVGGTRGRGGKGGKGYSSVYVISGIEIPNDIIAVPFPSGGSKTIDLKFLTRHFGSSQAPWFEQNSNSARLSKRDLLRHPDAVYKKFMPQNSKLTPGQYWAQFMNAASMAIPEIYSNWYSKIVDYDDRLQTAPEALKLFDYQNREASDWLQKIQRHLQMIDDWMQQSGSSAHSKGAPTGQEVGGTRERARPSQTFVINPPAQTPSRVVEKEKYRRSGNLRKRKTISER